MTTITGVHYKTGQPIKLSINNGFIESIQAGSDDVSEQDIIAPGLVDLQINGYKGIDFNDQPLTLNEWEKSVADLANVGVTTFYPTVITNSYEHLAYIFEENMKLLQENPLIKQFIGGFHLEGPYISPEDGPRGAHDKAHVRAPDWDEFCEIQEKAQGSIKLLTLSPEWPNTADFIRKVTDSGVQVAIGHTSANSEQIKAAVAAGATLSTHLGNGAHATLPRHPNYLWDQLAEEQLWASVIADGHHLPTSVLNVVQQTKDTQMIVVSDSVTLAGMEPGDYTTPVGGDVTLAQSGRLHLRDQPELLAGSAMNIFQGVQHLIREKIVNQAQGIEKASTLPAQLLNLPQKVGLTAGAVADIIVIKQTDDKWEVKQTIKAGKPIKT